MNPRERVFAALRGEAVDRPPISFWGHVYHRESSAADLVAATLEFYGRYHWDWVKLNPRKHYHVEPWGVSYRYSGIPNEKPVLDRWPIRDGGDWAKIGEVPHDQGALGEQLEAIRLLRTRLPADVPLIQTVFTPFAILGEMTRTPSSSLAAMLAGEQFSRKAMRFLRQAAKTRSRACFISGGKGSRGTVRYPSDRPRSPGPISAKPMPGTARIFSQTATPSGLSILTPSSRSPRALSGQGGGAEQNHPPTDPQHTPKFVGAVPVYYKSISLPIVHYDRQASLKGCEFFYLWNIPDFSSVTY